LVAARTETAHLEVQVAETERKLQTMEADCSHCSVHLIREAFAATHRRFQTFTSELQRESGNHAKTCSLRTDVGAELAVLTTRARFLKLFLEAAAKYEKTLVELLSDGLVTTLKQRRRTLNKEGKAVLHGWLKDHLAHPFPSALEKTDLATRLNVPVEQITTWFINARARKAPAAKRPAAATSSSSAASTASQLRPGADSPPGGQNTRPTKRAKTRGIDAC
jgi:hypothetical protein